MGTPFVSVVIPTYNYGRYVAQAVESVLAQTRPADEIIVVDDGSTDDTRERLAIFGDRIRYLHQANQGLSAARNAGIRAARGEWIALLDSDDLWHPRKLEAQLSYLARHPEVGLVAADTAKEFGQGWPDLGDLDAIEASPFRARDIVVRSRFGPSGVLMRKDCFDAVGFFDVALRSVEDRDMWLRVADRFPVVVLRAPLWWYRCHPGSMSAAAVRMETCEFHVLRRALASLASLRGSFWLKWKVYSYTAKSAAYRYDTSGMRLIALRRLLYSMTLWPLPFRSDEAIKPMERPKMLMLFLLRLLRSAVLRGQARVSPG